MNVRAKRKGQHRLRLGRVSLSGAAYHVTIATDRRRRHFDSLDAARGVILEMRRLDLEGWLQSLAWVLMPDHIHWLFVLGERPLPRTINRFKSSSARAVNRRMKCTGAIWQRGYYDHAIRQDEDLLSIARYIAANPLRAGLCADLGNYPNWDTVWL